MQHDINNYFDVFNFFWLHIVKQILNTDFKIEIIEANRKKIGWLDFGSASRNQTFGKPRQIRFFRLAEKLKGAGHTVSES